MMVPRSFDELPVVEMIRANRVCNQFERRWRSGEVVQAETMLAAVDEGDCGAWLQELIPLEIELRLERGDSVSLEEYRQRFPAIDEDWLSRIVSEAATSTVASQSTNVDDDAPHAVLPSVPSRLGDYTLVEHIGKGGMGVVYKAVHERMKRPVALKVLDRTRARQTQHDDRFLREIRATAALSHPNVVAAFDAREDQGVAYLVTELIEGRDLRQLVKDRGGLPLHETVDYVMQAARGLQYAHEHGVVHRDVKPANLLLDECGVVKLLDLGLARFTGDEDAELTTSEMIVGTAAFMAPEQAQRPAQADHRADIYSLGCTLYYLLTGRPIYRSTNCLSAVVAHANEPVPSLADSCPNAPPELDEVLRRMVAKEPEDRFSSMGEVIAALKPLSMSAATEGTATDKTSWRRFDSVFFTGAIAISVLLAVGWEIVVSFGERNAIVPQTPRVVDAKLRPGASAARATTANRESEQQEAARAEALPGDRSVQADLWALRFDGQSSSIQIASPGEPLDPVTLEAIVTPQRLQTGCIVCWVHGDQFLWLGMTGDGRWEISRRFSQPPDSPSAGRIVSSATRNRAALFFPVHLAAVFAGEQLRLYVDGIQQELDSGKDVLPADVESGVYIGGVPGHSTGPVRCFNGFFHAVRVTKGAFSSKRFSLPAGFADREHGAELLRYDLEEGTGNVARDSSGSGTDGSILGATWLRHTGVSELGFTARSSLGDEFTNPHTLQSWHISRRDLAAKILMTPQQQLAILPNNVGGGLWHDEQAGPLVYRYVTGDFTVAAQVTVSDDGRSLAGHHSALILRDPNSEIGKENWVGAALGLRGTLNCFSTLESQTHAKTDRSSASRQIRIERRADQFTIRRQQASGEWIVVAEFLRPDLPRTLQVGASAIGGGTADSPALFDYLRFAPGGFSSNEGLPPPSSRR